MHVTITTSPEGATLFEGQPLTLVSACNMIRRYACARSAIYHDGEDVPVVPLDGAPDLRGGERLMWDNPSPGCAYDAVAAKPLTRADFDRIERKVEELAARLQKMSTGNAFVPGDAKGTTTISVCVDTGPLERLHAMLAEMTTLRDTGTLHINVTSAPS